MGFERFDTVLARKVMRWMSLVLPVVCLLLCSTAQAAQCADENHRKSDKGWFFEGKKVEGADLATFHVLTGLDPYLESIPCVHDSGYAVDGFHAYWHGVVISGADPKTFSYLQFDYSRDVSHVYFRVAIVSGADPRTFTYIDQRYFKDSTHVYLRGTAIKDANPTTFSLLSNSWYPEDRLARDARHVFFGATVVYEANPKDVVDLGGPYWISNQAIFCKERPLKQANAASFHVAPKDVDAFLAEDKTHYFWDAQTLDKAECRKVGPAMLACEIYVWVLGYRYSQFDSASLHYLGEFRPSMARMKEHRPTRTNVAFTSLITIGW